MTQLRSEEVVEPVVVEPTEAQVVEGASEEELAIQQLIQAAKGMAPIELCFKYQGAKERLCLKSRTTIDF